MIKKTKEVLRKLEFGLLEFFVGVLMVIGLAGYFGKVPADLDWIDHTVSFILFSYLFYKLNITSILFGKTSRLANSIIIISYFSLFFKDIISYTKLSAFNFKVITFVNYLYVLLNRNLIQTNVLTFYIGIIGLLAISIYLAKKIEISHPSLLHALRQKHANASELNASVRHGKRACELSSQATAFSHAGRSELAHKSLKNRLAKFLSIFILLLGFYYFVYNTILEWLEFTIDDPVIATGVVFYIYKISKHHQKFHANNFIFKIGEFSTTWYKRFVSLFHYKKTLPLAISGLLILHALADLGVFAYSMIFLKENFYLEFLKNEHMPFLKLFLEDAKNLPSFAAIPLLIDYLLNALSLVTLLLIPIIVWARMFLQKEIHFGRIFLFFIYSSVTAYLLLPGYVILPLSELDIRGDETAIFGVDIMSISLLENNSFFYRLFPTKTAAIVGASLTSIIIGLAAYALSLKPKLKKEFYALSIIGSLAFYGVYIFYFFSSLLGFYDEILLRIFTPHFLIGITLAVFLMLSIIFYIMGYFMFLYEIVMEYHKRKWSEPIDEELLTAIRKMKSLERKIAKSKKSQFIGEVFKYGLVGIVSIIILIAGYGMLNMVKERACKTEISKFEIDLKGIDKSLRAGEKELQDYEVPCKADEIYFFDLGKETDIENFNETPVMQDSLKSRSNNVFLVKENEVKHSFYAGNIEIDSGYICFMPQFEKISFFVEGTGKSAKISSSDGQPECTLIPVNISLPEANKVIEEAFQFKQEEPEKCAKCPTDIDAEKGKIEKTKQHAAISRRFILKDKKTKVEIRIRSKGGSRLRDFTFYESIPKECVDDLRKYVEERTDEDAEVSAKDDPLIMWTFSEIKGEKKVSYRLNKELSNDCRDMIKGLGIAQSIESSSGNE